MIHNRRQRDLCQGSSGRLRKMILKKGLLAPSRL
jgi:hypothetical protein